MLYKRELINSFETIGYSCCIMMSIVIGPKWSFYSCCDYIGLFETGFLQVCIWVELPVQRRLCSIFVREVGSPDIHECFRGLTGSQRTPRFWGVTWVEHKPNHNYVQVWGPVMLLHHMKSFHDSSMLVYSV